MLSAVFRTREGGREGVREGGREGGREEEREEGRSDAKGKGRRPWYVAYSVRCFQWSSP